MGNNVYILKNYRHVHIALREILDKIDISRNKLCSMIAANYDLVNIYYNNKVIRIDLDIIAKMYYALDCKVDDILKYNK